MLAALEYQMEGPFEWGKRDCGTMYAHAVTAMTGCDPMCDFGVWDSEISALKCLAKTGHQTMLSYVSAYFQMIAPSQAGRGDIGFPDNRERLSCPAIITGSEAVSRNQSGILMIPRSSITVAFRVGRAD